MRRRPKVMLLEDGKPWDGIIPDWALEFRLAEWPGVHPWERWDAWWEAVHEWAATHMARGFDELCERMPVSPSRPWNQADI